MDLAALSTVNNASEGAWMHVRHPVTDEPLGTVGEGTEVGTAIRIKLRGTDSKEFKAAEHRMRNKKISAAVQKGKLDKNALRSEGMEAEFLDQLLDCTVDWENVEINGRKPNFSREEAKALYTACPFIREQAEAFITDRANFLGNS